MEFVLQGHCAGVTIQGRVTAELIVLIMSLSFCHSTSFLYLPLLSSSYILSSVLFPFSYSLSHFLSSLSPFYCITLFPFLPLPFSLSTLSLSLTLTFFSLSFSRPLEVLYSFPFTFPLSCHLILYLPSHCSMLFASLLFQYLCSLCPCIS